MLRRDGDGEDEPGGDGDADERLETSSNSAYAVPTAITQGSLQETMNWNSFLGMTGATNPNGATTSVSYDSATRPSVVTNPHGGSTTYTYTNSRLLLMRGR